MCYQHAAPTGLEGIILKWEGNIRRATNMPFPRGLKELF